MISWESLLAGDELPALDYGPVSRLVLAMFAGGSGDPNPVHIDLDFVKSLGMDDVFAHGMLSMAYAGRLLTQWVPQQQLRSFHVRFTSITPVRSTVKCTAAVKDKYIEDGERRIRFDLHAHIDSGVETLLGEAVIGFPEPVAA